MKAKSLPIAVLVALAAATSAFAGNGYDKQDRSEGAPRGAIVVGERAQQMSMFDYFFNNPEKTRTLRYDPGEYYKGLTREYDRP